MTQRITLGRGHPHNIECRTDPIELDADDKNTKENRNIERDIKNNDIMTRSCDDLVMTMIAPTLHSDESSCGLVMYPSLMLSSSLYRKENNQRVSGMTHSATWGMTTATLEELVDDNQRHVVVVDNHNGWMTIDDDVNHG
jgi:hypothetical protein